MRSEPARDEQRTLDKQGGDSRGNGSDSRPDPHAAQLAPGHRQRRRSGRRPRRHQGRADRRDDQVGKIVHAAPGGSDLGEGGGGSLARFASGGGYARGRAGRHDRVGAAGAGARDRLRVRRFRPARRASGEARHLHRGGAAGVRAKRTRRSRRRPCQRTRVLRAQSSSTPADLDAARSARQPDRRRTSPCSRRPSPRRPSALPSTGASPSARSSWGRCCAAGTADRLAAVGPSVYAEFWLPQQALADLTRRNAGAPAPPTSIPAVPGTARSPPSTRRSIRRRATCGCGRRSGIATGAAPAGHVRQRRGDLARRSARCWSSPRRRSSTRPTATRSSPSRIEDEEAPPSPSRSSSGSASAGATWWRWPPGSRPGETVVSSGAFKLRNGSTRGAAQRAGAQPPSSRRSRRTSDGPEPT